LIEEKDMSNLFKVPNVGVAIFSDADLKKMATLWQGNSELGGEAVKEKWKDVIGEENAYLFVKRLRQTVLSYKERIKRLYKIDPDEREQFEQDMVNTIVALESAFTLN
jgi:hypothetical protein